MLCLLLSGEAGLMHLTARGEQETDDTFLLIVNASHEAARQRLPAGSDGRPLGDADRYRQGRDRGGRRALRAGSGG